MKSIGRDRTRREARAREKAIEQALSIAGVGFGLLVLCLYLGGPWRSLIMIALLMIAAGGALLWISSLKPNRPPPPESTLPPAPLREPQRPLARQPTAPARPTTWGPEVFDVIEWRRFEAVVEALSQEAGFITRSKSHGADEGVDIWLYAKDQPTQLVGVVQCKHWTDQVGVNVVRELRGVMTHFQVERGEFATSSRFTEHARAFAHDNGIGLLDRPALLGAIARLPQDRQDALLGIALEGEYWRATCPSCGTKMIERQGGNQPPFWGCVNFPRCTLTITMRAKRSL